MGPISKLLAAVPGERVAMPDGVEGVVIANFETGQIAEGFDSGGWNSEEGGLLVSASFGSLVRYTRGVLE